MGSLQEDIGHKQTEDQEGKHACQRHALSCSHQHAAGTELHVNVCSVCHDSCDSHKFGDFPCHAPECSMFHEYYPCHHDHAVHPDELVVGGTVPHINNHGLHSKRADIDVGACQDDDKVSHEHANLSPTSHLFCNACAFGHSHNSSTIPLIWPEANASNCNCEQSAAHKGEANALGGYNTICGVHGDDNDSGVFSHGMQNFEDKFCLDCNGKSDVLDGPTRHHAAATCGINDDASNNMHYVACNGEGNVFDAKSKPIIGFCNDIESSTTNKAHTYICRSECSAHTAYNSHTESKSKHYVNMNGQLHDHGMPEPVEALQCHQYGPSDAHETCIKNCVYPAEPEVGCEPDMVFCDIESYDESSFIGAVENFIDHEDINFFDCRHESGEDNNYVLEGNDMFVHNVHNCESSIVQDLCVHDVMVNGDHTSGKADSRVEDLCVHEVMINGDHNSSGKGDSSLEDLCVHDVMVNGDHNSSGKGSGKHSTPNLETLPTGNNGSIGVHRTTNTNLGMGLRTPREKKSPSTNKKLPSSKDRAPCAPKHGAFAFIHSKKMNRPLQHQHIAPSSFHKSSSLQGAQGKDSEGINLGKLYANASFSTCLVKLPSTKSSHTKNLPLMNMPAPKVPHVLSRSTSSSGELQKTSLYRRNPLSSSFGPKKIVQSPSASSHESLPTPKNRPALKLASNSNVSSTPSITTSQVQTSAAFARLIALPLVNAKAREEVRLDLRGQKVKSLDCNLVNLTAKLEFVYLRDNKLSHLAGIEILRRVKVLDLSFNDFKGLGMEPLASCKALQQLYLAGNQMTCLSSLPQLPNLELLSVAQNKLKDLRMVTQPKLQVLAASKNKVTTFKGFPHFPSLEHLRLEENPLSEMPHVQAAAILLVGPTLKRFNNQDITMEEQEIACMYPPHAGLCIQDGWEFCDAEKAYASSFNFLVEKWTAQTPSGYALEQAFVEQPSQDFPCSCVFVLKRESSLCEELDLNFQYQWFIGGKTPSDFVPIRGAIQEVYWPKHEDVGHCLKVECVFVAGGIEYPPLFAISFPVLPGTGCPKVINLGVSGDFREGNMICGSVEVAWCGGSPSRGIVSWLRHDESCSPRMVPGAEEMEYLLSLDDVGAKLILMYTPLSKEGVKGEPRFATTDTIQAGLPSVTSLRVFGDLVEGNALRGIGKYFGGKEGASHFEWLQEVPESGRFQLVTQGSADFFLTEKDIGLRMMFQYTPVNSEGFKGIPSSIVTEKVAYAPPRVTSLQIMGELCEGSTVRISATISSAGIEGASHVRWFKTKFPDKTLVVADMEEIGTSKPSENFLIPLGAVGFYLVAKYTPVLLDGLAGEHFLTVSSMAVEVLPPRLDFLSIMGEYREGETLVASYNYIGGQEGNSQFIWYLHENDGDPGSPIAEAAGLLAYTITKSAINKFVSFKCIPLRDDGCVGEERTVMGESLVHPGFPKLLSLDIAGDPKEGSNMQIVKSYFGGLEGSSKIQWFQMNSLGNLKRIEGATSHTYTSTAEDVDSFICVSYEPYRLDGRAGTVVVSQPFGPVSPGPPTCEDLKLYGETVEGEHLKFSATYRGGVKGSCICQWVRQQADGLEKKLSIRDTLKLTLEDIGCCIKLVYTPVRKDGVRGISKAVVSDVIKAGEPSAIRLIIPNGCEDAEMIPQKVFFGGIEGNSEFTWFQLADKLEGLIDFNKAQAVGRLERYTPNLEDVGSYLALLWVPIRKDGKQGKPCLACSSQKVVAAPPLVHSVTVKRTSRNVYVGDGTYYGGVEGESQTRWYRQASDGVMTPIPGAFSRIYTIKDDDYTYSLVFGYTPVRQDGIAGKLLLSAPTEKILPDVPKVEKLLMRGKAIEGKPLTVSEQIPHEENQQHVWSKFIKEVKYQWSRSVLPDNAESFETLTFQRNCSYTIRTIDIGYFIKCECIVIDIFGRLSPPVSVISSAVAAGMPRVDKLEIEGRGYHSDMYAIRGIYSGGKEGKSVIQWFRAMARRLQLVPIAGEVGRMYEANVMDVGYRLVAVYTPVRDDGVEGTPVSVSTDPIQIEPAIAEQVDENLRLGSLRFEALLNRAPTPTKFYSKESVGLFEKRIIDVDMRRIKAVKPGPKTFLTTDLRFTTPFQADADKGDQHRLKIIKEGENKMELMVQSRHIRDLVVLTINGFKFQI